MDRAFSNSFSFQFSFRPACVSKISLRIDVINACCCPIQPSWLYKFGFRTCSERGCRLSSAETFRHFGCNTGLVEKDLDDTFLLDALLLLGMLVVPAGNLTAGLTRDFGSGCLIFSLSTIRVDCWTLTRFDFPRLSEMVVRRRDASGSSSRFLFAIQLIAVGSTNNQNWKQMVGLWSNLVFLWTNLTVRSRQIWGKWCVNLFEVCVTQRIRLEILLSCTRYERSQYIHVHSNRSTALGLVTVATHINFHVPEASHVYFGGQKWICCKGSLARILDSKCESYFDIITHLSSVDHREFRRLKRSKGNEMIYWGRKLWTS